MSHNAAEVVSKLMDLTDSKEVKWFYLYKNETLYNNLELYPSSPSLRKRNAFEAVGEQLTFSTREKFLKEESFYTEVPNGYIIILKKARQSTNDELTTNDLYLYIVPSSYMGEKVYSDVEGLLRLFNKVKSLFPSVDAVIDDLFKL